MKKSLKPYTSEGVVREYASKLSRPVDAEFITEFTQRQYSKSSCLCITSDWNHFISFCDLHGCTALPATPSTVVQFIEYESRSRRYNTLKRYVVSIGVVHYLLLSTRPTTAKEVKICLLKYTSTDAHSPTQINPLKSKQLDKAGNALNPHKNIKDLRDLCMANLMFDAALKRSELVNLNTGDIIDDGEQMFVSVGDNHYPLRQPTAELVRMWIEYSTSQETPLFRAINKGHVISEQRADDSTVYRALRRISSALKLPKHAQLSGQSGRVGAVQAKRNEGCNVPEIKDFCRYSSLAMVYQYTGQTEMAETETAKHREASPWD